MHDSDLKLFNGNKAYDNVFFEYVYCASSETS